MPGIGPRAEPGQDRTPDVDAAARVGTWASQQAFRLGAEQERARLADAAYDVGYGANNTAADRAHVHAVHDGFTAGLAARYDLIDQVKNTPAAPGTQPRLPEPEREAEAG